MTRLILHIGTNKTGTTAIQHALAANRDALRERGLLYPVTGVRSEAHHEVGWKLGFVQGRPAAMDDEPFEPLWARMRAEIAAARCPHVLLSTECFMLGGGRIAALAQAVRDFDVEVVVYLRRHDLWLQSVYVQAVKVTANPPWGRGYEAYLAHLARQKSESYGSHRRLVDRWAQAFGRERVRVRPFEAGQVDADITRDLLRTIGLEALGEQLKAPTRQVNASFGYTAIAYMDAVQRSGLPPPVKRHLVGQAALHGLKAPKVGPMLPPARQRELVEPHLDDYAYIARQYLGRADGRLFHAPLPRDDDPWQPPQPPDDSQIAEMTARYLARANAETLALLIPARPGQPVRSGD